MSLRRFFFRLLFLDTSHLIRKARTEILHEADMPALPDRLNPQTSQTIGRLKVSLPGWKFIFSLIPVYREHLIRGYSFYSIAMVSSLLSPILIHQFIHQLQEGSNLKTTLFYGVSLALCGVISGLCLQQYFYKTLTANQMITNDLNQLIFRQSLELSLQSRTNSQVGDIVNHMSSDTEALSDVPIVIGDLVWAVIMISSVAVMLFFYIGWSALAALIVLSGSSIEPPLWVQKRNATY